jgi:hypothetical protein
VAAHLVACRAVLSSTELVSIVEVRFEVFTAVTMKNDVFWDVTWYFFAACVGC